MTWRKKLPLPIDAAPLGAPGCPIRQSAEVNMGLKFSVANVASWSVAIPNSPIFLGLKFHTQAFSIDPPANALGGTVSDAATAVIGTN